MKIISMKRRWPYPLLACVFFVVLCASLFIFAQPPVGPEFDCGDLIWYQSEPCWGADTMYCENDENWQSLCKLRCEYGGGPDRVLYCNPYE